MKTSEYKTLLRWTTPVGRRSRHLRIHFRKSPVSREERAAVPRSIVREIELASISASAG